MEELTIRRPNPLKCLPLLTSPRLQIAAIPFLEPQRVQQERLALQHHFKAKRDHVLGRLERLGLKVHVYPHATFYIWLNLQTLPEPLNNGLVSTS